LKQRESWQITLGKKSSTNKEKVSNWEVSSEKVSTRNKVTIQKKIYLKNS